MRFSTLLAIGAVIAHGADAAAQAILDYGAIHHPAQGSGGMVCAQDAIAAQIGADVLAAGGNAIDAAVAVGFAEAVTLPRAGNLGGGGFLVAFLAAEGKAVALDFREIAPAKASRDMFLGADGEPDPALSQRGHLASGVPGTVRGLAAALERFGTRSLAESLAPAIRLAEGGFPVGADLAASLRAYRKDFARSPAAMAAFFKADGSAYRVGETLRQPDLAKTLRLIAEGGPDAFYGGPIAEALAADMAAHGGLITREDMRGYQPVWREPVRGTYRGCAIVSMPPPSSGGIHLIQMLNVLEHFPLNDYGSGSAKAIHTMAETMKLAYADRSEHLGDPAFYRVPQAWLTSKEYAADLAKRIDPERATPSAEIKPGAPPAPEGPETTHFSVIDAAGNAVALTYTLNFSYGSRYMVPGTGFLLNNEMDDFSAKPGAPNAYGLVGGEANAVAPGKRMLSSMTPTLVLRDGKAWIATGSPGGSRIITAVLQNIVNIVDHGMNIAEANAAPRFHHQWLPDALEHERGFSPDTLAALRALGHQPKPANAMGSVQSVAREGDRFFGAPDPRRPGAGAFAAGD